MLAATAAVTFCVSVSGQWLSFTHDKLTGRNVKHKVDTYGVDRTSADVGMYMAA
jgi:hypothetical protein